LLLVRVRMMPFSTIHAKYSPGRRVTIVATRMREAFCSDIYIEAVIEVKEDYDSFELIM
jgi:hypothetical protein